MHECTCPCFVKNGVAFPVVLDRKNCPVHGEVKTVPTDTERVCGCSSMAAYLHPHKAEDLILAWTFCPWCGGKLAKGGE